VLEKPLKLFLVMTKSVVRIVLGILGDLMVPARALVDLENKTELEPRIRNMMLGSLVKENRLSISTVPPALIALLQKTAGTTGMTGAIAVEMKPPTETGQSKKSSWYVLETGPSTRIVALRKESAPLLEV